MKSGLAGPYPLSFDAIAEAADNCGPGVFALGYVDARGAFRINAVGRADRDLGRTLRDLIGSDQAFKFDRLPSIEAAFERECALFHDFRPPATRFHPTRPAGTMLNCPRCGFFSGPALPLPEHR